MTDFRNAYHFVPRGLGKGTDLSVTLPTSQKDFGLRPGHESEGHAVYAPGAFSGRIKCRITLECPTIIGGKRTPGVDKSQPAYVAPFLFKDRPAIPATSLKGMLSSVAEAASRAPYRVLTNMNLTVAFIKKDKSVEDRNGNPSRFSVRHQNIGGNRSVNRKHLTAATAIGTTHDYFDPALHPMQITHGALSRAHVNPVESMFGFVAEAHVANQKAGRDKVSSAAGKLRVSHALPSGLWADRATDAYFLSGEISVAAEGVPKNVKLTLLKEQGEPMKQPKRQEDHVKKAGPQPEDYKDLKSATPNFYFVDVNKPGRFISKEDFATRPTTNFRAQGGKFYLHNPDSVDPTLTPWKSAAPTKGEGVERKAAAAILQRQVTFDFHIDFDNLTQHELNILCFALRPSKRFRHKIGLGKALGLGSIRIDVQDLVLIDRKARYSADNLFAPDPREVAEGTGAALAETYASDHSDWLEQNDKGAKKALLQIGQTHLFDQTAPAADLQDAKTPVLWVPLTEERFRKFTAASVAAEEESFKWFTLTDLAKDQSLGTIGETGIPKLQTVKEATPLARAPARPVNPPQPGEGPTSKASSLSHRGRISKVKKNPDGSFRAWVIDGTTKKSHVIKEALCRQGHVGPDSEGRSIAFEIFEQRPGDTFDPAVRTFEFID